MTSLPPPPFIQTEQDLLKVHTYIPKDLVSIISDYLPCIDFTWTNDNGKGFPWRKPECDTTIHWNGPFTYGNWRHGIFQIGFQNNVFERDYNGNITYNELGNHGHSFIYRLVRILKGERVPGQDMRLFSYEEVGDYNCFPDENCTYYGNPIRAPPHDDYVRFVTWWTFKCDVKPIIEEIKFVFNTIITNPNYNRAFFNKPCYQALL
jgi:hypothetical protein